MATAISSQGGLQRPSSVVQKWSINDFYLVTSSLPLFSSSSSGMNQRSSLIRHSYGAVRHPETTMSIFRASSLPRTWTHGICRHPQFLTWGGRDSPKELGWSWVGLWRGDLGNGGAVLNQRYLWRKWAFPGHCHSNAVSGA